MAKFKVGDKVRVREWDDMVEKYGVKYDTIQVPWLFTEDMRKYCGCVVTIKEVVEKPDCRSYYYIEEDNKKHPFDNWKFSEEMLESKVVKDINPSIVIYKKGNKVIAIDKTTGKTAEAICNEDDEFDFYTGADLAFERLRGRKPAPKTKENAPKFYNADIVCIRSMSCSFEKGKVYKVRDGKLVGCDWLPGSRRYKSLEEINNAFASQFIELVK